MNYLEFHRCIGTKLVTGFNLFIALKVQSIFKKPLFELEGSSNDDQHNAIELPWEEVIALGKKLSVSKSSCFFDIP